MHYMDQFTFGTGEYYMAKSWQSGARLASAFNHQLRFSKGKPLSSGECVRLWRSFRAQVGYSGMLPMYANPRPRTYDALSAAHNGITGLGAKLKGIIKEACLSPL